MGMVQSEVAAPKTTAAPAERQKIAEK